MHQTQLCTYDVAIVGSGILGLAAAWAAVRRGLKVIVFEKNPTPDGASLRNFGFITVTGQDPEHIWPRARRTRQLWLQLCEESGIRIHQLGMLTLAQRQSAALVLQQFLETREADQCRLLSRAEIRKLLPSTCVDHVIEALFSPTEIRVESREAIPRFIEWLETSYGVQFVRNCTVLGIDHTTLNTSQGVFKSINSIVCPGALDPPPEGAKLTSAGITQCVLQMLRLANPGFRLPATVMSDLSLIRYQGFSQQPAAVILNHELKAERPELLLHGIHLIVAPSIDGSLVVGDSHHYSDTPSLARIEEIDSLICSEYENVFKQKAPPIIDRWVGVYASRAGAPVVMESPQPNVRVLTVTSGCGASIGLSLGEEVIQSLFG